MLLTIFYFPVDGLMDLVMLSGVEESVFECLSVSVFKVYLWVFIVTLSVVKGCDLLPVISFSNPPCSFVFSVPPWYFFVSGFQGSRFIFGS